MAARPPSVYLTGTSNARRQPADGSWQTGPLAAVFVCRVPSAGCRLAQGEPEPLMGRREERANFWDAVFCNRPPPSSPSPLLGEGWGESCEDRSRRSGNGPGIEPVKMFGAVRGSPSRAAGASRVETVPASVRIVKLSTSYFFGGEILSPSEVRSLDFGGHKEVRRLGAAISPTRT